MGWRRVARACSALLLACFAAIASVPDAHAQAEPPDIVVILLDDVGVELLGAYTYWRGKEVVGWRPVEHRVTPNIDALAEKGLLFRNAWSAPLCGPTRLSLFTGLYGFHTGAIETAREAAFVPATLAERLRDDAAAPYPERVGIGKWSLSSYTPYRDRRVSPTVLGFTSYAGSPRSGSYRGYEWVTDPPPEPAVKWFPRAYAVEQEVSEAIAFVEAPHAGPWLLWLALHAAHAPWDEAETPADASSRCHAIGDTPRRVRCRQLEIADEALGALFAALEAADPGLANTTVFLLGDNGSPVTGGTRPEAIPGQLNRGAKGTVYEGGINVPLIVAGAGVAPNAPDSIQESDALVHVVDVFATVLDLAGVPSPDSQIDGRSFAAALAGAPGPRSCVYADGSATAGNTPAADPAHHDVAIRNHRYKLIRRAEVLGTHDYELYDLRTDPGETSPLPESGAVFEALRAELERIDGNRASSPCKPAAALDCGLGPELLPALAALTALHRRRRRRR